MTFVLYITLLLLKAIEQSKRESCTQTHVRTWAMTLESGGTAFEDRVMLPTTPPPSMTSHSFKGTCSVMVNGSALEMEK